MGTKCLTRLFDEHNVPLVTLYRQSGGYPSGHGLQLAEFLRDFIVVNGIPMSHGYKKIANGAGCLAAQVIAHFKYGVGGFYIYPATYTGEQYEYDVYVTTDMEPTISVKNRSGSVLFHGTATETSAWIKERNDDNE